MFVPTPYFSDICVVRIIQRPKYEWQRLYYWVLIHVYPTSLKAFFHSSCCQGGRSCAKLRKAFAKLDSDEKLSPNIFYFAMISRFVDIFLKDLRQKKCSFWGRKSVCFVQKNIFGGKNSIFLG